MYNKKFEFGFTIIEGIIVSLIIATIFGLVGVNLSSTKQRLDIQTAVTSLYSEIKNQQIKAMTGETTDNLNPTDHGVFFDNDKYILFRSGAYDPDDQNNIRINLEDNLVFANVSFDQSQIVFAKGTGEIIDFDDNQNTFEIKSANTSQNKKITINRYGVFTQIE